MGCKIYVNIEKTIDMDYYINYIKPFKKYINSGKITLLIKNEEEYQYVDLTNEKLNIELIFAEYIY
jgi:hypothetical protein